MIDLRRGIIRIGDKQGLFGYIHDFTLLAMYFAICFLNNGKTLNTLAHYTIFGAFCLVTAIDITRQIYYEHRYKIPLSLIWYGLFTVFAVASYAWAINPESVIQRFKMLLEVLVFSFGVTTYLSTKERLYRFFNIVCTAITVLGFVLLARTMA